MKPGTWSLALLIIFCSLLASCTATAPNPYDPDYIHMDTWPFVRDYATIEDVKCAGFDIVGG